MDRRKFLQKFGIGASGAVASVSVAPGLFEGFWNWLASLKPIRKLKAVWTYEISEELNCFWSREVEEDITALMAEEIRKEIDREILKSLLKNEPLKI